MSFKNKVLTLSLLISACVLLIIFGAVFGPGRPAKHEPLLAVLKLGNLREVSFIAKGGTNVLRKEASGEWRVVRTEGAFPAAEEKVKRFLDVLGEARVSDGVTEKEENWKSFNLEEPSEKKIVLTGDQGKAEILLGKPAGLGNSEYIRFAGEKSVFILSQGLSYYAEQKTVSWYELRLFPKTLEGKHVVSLSAKGCREKNDAKESSNYKFIRENDEKGQLKWIDPDDKSRRLKQSAVEGLAGALAALRGTDFAAGNEGSAGIDEKPDLLLDFTAEDQKAYTAAFRKKAGEKQWFCRGTIDGRPLPYTYLLNENSYGRIAVSMKDLVE